VSGADQMPEHRPPGVAAWDGDAYQRRFDALAESGVDVHGEAAFVASFAPRTVLDAGCGSGRVASELTRHGIGTIGIDRDRSMIATARTLAPDLDFRVEDVVSARLGMTFDVVVMAGNVPLFTPEGTQVALVAGCARHIAAGGRLVAGFQLGRGYGVADYDAACAAAGLGLEERWATWDRAPFADDADYAVSVHRLAP